jgi:predicted AlkP superfamily phosphohydrolase/phosphomutase
MLGRLPGSARDRIAARATGTSRVDWSQSQAYRIPLYPPAEGIVVNLRGRQQQGAVAPGGDYERVRDRIIEVLQGLRDPSTGAPVVQWARRREELFAGDHLDEAPDVVVLFDPAYKGASGLDRPFEAVPDQILDEYSGVHAMEGVFAAAGRGIRQGVDLGTRSILDVAPTLLALLGRPVPADADGDVMEAALEDAAAVRTGDATSTDREQAGDPALTAEEEATLEESLRALGYLE